MMKIEQLCQTLHEYLAQFSQVRVLFPLAAPVLYVCGAIFVVNVFISFGSVISALAFLLGIVMMVLTLAQCQFLSLAIGLGLYALNYAVGVVRSLVLYRYVAYGSLIYLLFYGLLAYLAYRKSLSLR